MHNAFCLVCYFYILYFSLTYCLRAYSPAFVFGPLLAMFARISDTVCLWRTAALFAIVTQMSFLSAYISK